MAGDLFGSEFKVIRSMQSGKQPCAYSEIFSGQTTIISRNLFVAICLVPLISTFTWLYPQEVQAQKTIDVAKITCRQYLFDRSISLWAPRIVTWLSGYFNGIRKNTTIDVGLFRINKDKFENYCRMNQDTTLIDAAKKRVGIDK